MKFYTLAFFPGPARAGQTHFNRIGKARDLTPSNFELTKKFQRFYKSFINLVCKHFSLIFSNTVAIFNIIIVKMFT